jgi:hypothetical protein
MADIVLLIYFILNAVFFFVLGWFWRDLVEIYEED